MPKSKEKLIVPREVYLSAGVHIGMREKNKQMMEKPGFTVARWYEGVLLNAKELGQDVNVKAFYFGIAAALFSLFGIYLRKFRR